MKKYTLYGEGGDILREGNNKRWMVSFCSGLQQPGTIVDERNGGIIYENKAQRDINNGKHQPGKLHWFNIDLLNRKTDRERTLTISIEADEENAFRFATNRGIEFLRETRKSGGEYADKWVLKAVVETTYYH